MKKLLTIMLLLHAITVQAITKPNGIYALDRVQNLPFVSGVVIRAKWADLEKTEGVYDFSSIEKTIREAVAVGQSVTLTNMVVYEPAWLMNKIPAANKYAGIWDTDVVPWDATMQAAVQKLASAEANFKIDGVALKDHPAIKQIDAPVATANGVRLRTKPTGYTATLYNDAAIKTIKIWTDAFGATNHHFFTAIFGISFDKTNEVVIRDRILSELDGVKNPIVNGYIEYLTGAVPQPGSASLLFEFTKTRSVLMQTCGSWTAQNGYWATCNWLEPVDTPADGFKLGIDTWGTLYYELYQDDLKNTVYATQLQAASDKIKSLAGPVTPPPPVLSCAEQSINWGDLSTVCLGITPVIKDGMSSVILDTTAPATGSVTANCAAGKIILSNPVCTSVPDPCVPPPPPTPPPTPVTVKEVPISTAVVNDWLAKNPASLPANSQHLAFRSVINNADTGYMIYTPPGYAQDITKTYQVIYYLHGINGSEINSATWLLPWFDSAIKSGAIDPVIVVIPSGGKSSMWIDATGSVKKGESMVIKELIPLIDSKFRTIKDRSGRWLEGFSMGGFGSAHFLLKYPEYFSSAVTYAGAFGAPEVSAADNDERPDYLISLYDGSDKAELYPIKWRQVVGSQDLTRAWNLTTKALLDASAIAHEFKELPGLTHRDPPYYTTDGVTGVNFH